MDPDLEPRLSGQLMTPTAIGQLAQDVINAGQASPAQTKAMSWVIDHKVWTLWRDLPHMTNAATTHEHLVSTISLLGSPRESAGAGARKRLALDADGSIHWFPDGGGMGTLVDSATSSQYYESIRPMTRAWSLLLAVAPDATGSAITKALGPLQDQIRDQLWWAALADNSDPMARITALLAAPLAQLGDAAMQARRAEEERIAKETEALRQASDERERIEARRAQKARAMNLQRFGIRRFFINMLLWVVVGVGGTGLAAVWAGYARTGTIPERWWSAQLFFGYLWFAGALVQQLILLYGRITVAGRVSRGEAMPPESEDAWLWMVVFTGSIGLAFWAFSQRAAEHAGHWYPMNVGPGYFLLAASPAIAQVAVTVKRLWR